MAFRSQLVCPQHFCFAGLPFSYPWLPDFGFLAASTGIALCRMESCGAHNRNCLDGHMNKPLGFWSLSTTEILQQLQTAKEGLTNDEAKERLARYGSNLLKPS